MLRRGLNSKDRIGQYDVVEKNATENANEDPTIYCAVPSMPCWQLAKAFAQPWPSRPGRSALMAVQVCSGAALGCSFGAAPATLNVTPQNAVLTGTPAATIMDHMPMVNITPFGMCSSAQNPVVIAATALALGAPTPAPCIPLTPSPWAPGAPTVRIANLAALDNSSKLNCIWGGIITVSAPGETIVLIP